MVSKHLMWAEISTVKLVHILYWIKFNNWYQDPHSVKSMPKPPLRQVQVEQNVFFTHGPQQSPPSKLHSECLKYLMRKAIWNVRWNESPSIL